MIVVVCDTTDEKDCLVRTLNQSDYCPFGRRDNYCYNHTCKECVNNNIKFIVKEEEEK